MIRHHLACAALSLTLLCGAPAFAQAPALSQGHLQAAREVVELTGVSQNIDNIFTEFTENTKQLVGATRPELLKDMNEILVALKPEADKRSAAITTTAVEVFARKMTEADLKEVAAFFKSPVGQRYTTLRPQAMQDLYTVLQPWSVQTSNYLFDRFSQEMRKRGHQL
jgi:hypothetical protein